MSTGKFFTTDEDQFILENWSSLSPQQIATKLSRSVSGIRKRAKKLGCEFRTCSRWTKEEDEILMNSQGLLLKEVAILLGRCVSECSNRASRLGILSWAHHRNGGQFKNRRGYVIVGFKPRSSTSSTRAIFEHHVVMEKKIGRKLKRGEVVHHINAVKDDNREENLHLCKNASAHRKIHNSFEFLMTELIAKGIVKFNHEDEKYYTDENL